MMSPPLSCRLLILLLPVVFASSSSIGERSDFLRSPSQSLEDIDIEVFNDDDSNSNESSIHHDYVLVKTWDQIPVRNVDRYGRRLEDDEEEDDDATYVMTNPIARSAATRRRHVADNRYLSNEENYYDAKYDAPYDFDRYSDAKEYADGMYRSSSSRSRGGAHGQRNSHSRSGSRSHSHESHHGHGRHSGSGSGSKSAKGSDYSGNRSGSKSGKGSDYSGSEGYSDGGKDGYGDYYEYYEDNREYGRGAADYEAGEYEGRAYDKDEEGYGGYEDESVGAYEDQKAAYKKTYRAKPDDTDMDEGFETTEVVKPHRNKIEARSFTTAGKTLRGSCNYSQRSKTNSSCRRRRQGASSGHRTSSKVQKIWMRMHNVRRTKYHKKYGGKYRALYWNDELADLAQEWADRLAELPKCRDYHHDDCGEEGENLGVVWSSKSGVEKMETLHHAWCEAEELGPNERYRSGHGHMTQLLWRATRYVGCAYAYKESASEKFGGCHIYACRYAKPGNCNRDPDNWLRDVMSDDSPCTPDCPACMSSSKCIRN